MCVYPEKACGAKIHSGVASFLTFFFAKCLYTGDNTIFREQCLTADVLYTVYTTARQLVYPWFNKEICFKLLSKTEFSCFILFLFSMKTKSPCATFRLSFIHKNHML